MHEEGSIIYWIIMASFFMPLILSSILIWFFISFQKKKHQSELEKKDLLLREQQLIIENQTAIETERTRIASEMHDDLGSGLTMIRYLSDRALKNVATEEEKIQIGKIAEQSSALVRNMSEIIWAMNSRYDTVDNLLSYIRHYTSEYLGSYHIDIDWHQGDWVGDMRLNGEKRRNVFLVIKEALHNIVKHAKASKVIIHVHCDLLQLFIHIQDNGIGFDPQLSESKGNGLYNIRKRMNTIGGDCSFEHKSQGTTMKIIIPLFDELRSN